MRQKIQYCEILNISQIKFRQYCIQVSAHIDRYRKTIKVIWWYVINSIVVKWIWPPRWLTCPDVDQVKKSRDPAGLNWVLNLETSRIFGNHCHLCLVNDHHSRGSANDQLSVYKIIPSYRTTIKKKGVERKKHTIGIWISISPYSSCVRELVVFFILYTFYPLHIPPRPHPHPHPHPSRRLTIVKLKCEFFTLIIIMNSDLDTVTEDILCI